MVDILHLLQVQAPREAVYQAIATVEGVRNWFSRDADLDSRIGGSGEIRFANRQRIIKMEIEELEPTVRVVWRVLSAAMPNWANTKVEFGIGAGDEGTLLHFAHRGFTGTNDFFAMSATAWAGFLISLKQYAETGKGMPHPDDPLSRAPSTTSNKARIRK